MTLQFDGNGVQTNTFDEIFEDLDTGYRDIYGQDIITDQESPDGQRIGIESAARFDIESGFAWLYSQIDPDLNNGDMQQIIGKLAGVSLLPASRSQWDLVVNVSRNITISNEVIDYTIEDQNGVQWFLDSDVTLTTGDNNVTFLSVLWGSVAGVSAGSSFTQSTPELYVVSISANTDATQGREEETPEEFRLRRKASTENSSEGTVGSIYAKMAQINGVTDLAIYDNGSNTADQLTGSSNQGLIGSSEPITIEEHTVWAIIEGGSLDDIGAVMTKNNLGNSKGDIEVSYQTTLTRPDNTSIIVTDTNKVDRPTYVPLYIRLTATLFKLGETIDTAAIKAKLATYKFYIGYHIQAGELYPSSYITNYNYISSDLEISLDGVTWTNERLFSGYAGKFTIDAANITITEA